MQAKFLALLWTFNIILWWSASAQEVTSIFSIVGPVLKIPSETFSLRPRAILSCALSIAPGVRYTTQWSGPAGIIDPNTNTDCYVITEGVLRLTNGSDFPGTTLAIRKLSYQDAGVYTCSGRSLAASNEEVPSSSWVSAEIDLQLDTDLSSKFNETLLMATTSDSTVELSCEMSAFIRPDSSLIWEGPHNQILTSGIGKYQITFSNGSSDTAVDGSGTLAPSRVSTLTISNPAKSDQGVYTCSVMGTNKTVDLVIMINDAKTSPATTVSLDLSTETEASTRATAVSTVMDKTTNPRSVISTTKSMTVTQKVQSGSQSYINSVVAFYAVIITSVAGVLVQYYIM